MNLAHCAGAQSDYYPIGYRIYVPEQDGKTKNDHIADMVRNAVYARHFQAKRIVFDTWHASADNLKLAHRSGLVFFTTLKINRTAGLSKEEGWIRLNDMEWTPERLRDGVIVKLKEVPFKAQLFKLVAPNGDID